jgi:hypothetical protein
MMATPFHFGVYGPEHLGQGKAAGPGFGQEFTTQVLQSFRPAPRPPQYPDQPLFPAQQARPLEPGVGPFDQHGAHRQPHCDMAHGGQRFAREEGAAEDEPAELLLDLLSDRGTPVEDQFGLG